MVTSDLFDKYRASPTVAAIVQSLTKGGNVRLKGLSGSSDALISAAVVSQNDKTHVFLLHDKEEAAYFLDDLRNFVSDTECLLFPGSYKKPYQFEETDNANILLRAEVLSKINAKGHDRLVVVTYPDALYEKVINKTSLTENTFQISKGEKLDVEFVNELLISYDFERVDFVYEAGQFSVRGGIIDVFSFGNEYPYRLELFGDEIESLREFDPETQLSRKPLTRVNLLPNIQTKLLKEPRQSFLDFLPQDSCIWLKDYRETLDLIEKGYNKAEESFAEMMRKSGDTQVVFSPKDLFDSEKTFDPILRKFNLIEFGNRFYLKPKEEYKFEIKPQPHFNKNFELLAKDLFEFQSKGYQTVIIAESVKQIQRLGDDF